MNKYYYLSYEPPSWSVNYDENDFNIFAKQSLVFYYNKKYKKLIQKLITNREPTNIAMNKLYNHDLVKKELGYKESFYTEFFKKYKVIAPNIGIYCFTPILFNNKFFNCHVYNAIGMAFDYHTQPDYIYYKSINFNKQKLIKKYTNILEKIVKCCNVKNLKNIILPLIGCGHFSTLYPGNLTHDIFIPTLIYTQDKYTDINFVIMGSNNSIKHQSIKTTNFLFPNIIENINISDTLLVNAWDPHSVPGNGNSSDKRLDGYFGRYSMISRLGWGITNKFLLNSENWFSIK